MKLDRSVAIFRAPFLAFFYLFACAFTLSSDANGGDVAQPETSRPKEPVPDDFSLLYDWSNGPLAPQYHYEYQIGLSADGRGQLILRLGYASKFDDGRKSKAEFHVGSERVTELFQKIFRAESSIRRSKRQDEPVGGTTCALRVTYSGKQRLLPCQGYQVTSTSFSQQRKLMESISSLVPEEIWADLGRALGCPLDVEFRGERSARVEYCQPRRW